MLYDPPRDSEPNFRFSRRHWSWRQWGPAKNTFSVDYFFNLKNHNDLRTDSVFGYERNIVLSSRDLLKKYDRSSVAFQRDANFNIVIFVLPLLDKRCLEFCCFKLPYRLFHRTYQRYYASLRIFINLVTHLYLCVSDYIPFIDAVVRSISSSLIKPLGDVRSIAKRQRTATLSTHTHTNTRGGTHSWRWYRPTVTRSTRQTIYLSVRGTGNYRWSRSPVGGARQGSPAVPLVCAYFSIYRNIETGTMAWMVWRCATPLSVCCCYNAMSLLFADATLYMLGWKQERSAKRLSY